ncbi:HNH endonuclease [Deinococcus sp. 14RED07]|uniref:NUMOD4 domain-containing protein n=1 Tax=Deinococcus sp. 14RED07 TaxID=2745874 RepID=UPI001E59AB09|nr:NUMOD4 domain-containing protein [Deinococcus sp. 14RED07]MCD0175821.1 HNH endonuclease [Deinococcus sp. 14RED07]
MKPPEAWKAVPGPEHRYEASTHGRVRSLDRTIPTAGGRTAQVKGRVLKPVVRPNGLATVTCDGQRFQLHLLIAELFVDRPPGTRYVQHRNGDRSDNAAENLEWVRSLRPNGATDDQIAMVGAMQRAFRMTQRDMADRTGLSVWQIGQIIKDLDG